MDEKDERALFFQWMIQSWTIHGGLITQTTAAKLIGVTKGRITQMIREGKLKELRYQKQSFVQYGTTMKIAFEKNKTEMMEAIKTEVEHPAIPPEIKMAILQEFLPQMKQLFKQTMPETEQTEQPQSGL